MAIKLYIKMLFFACITALCCVALATQWISDWTYHQQRVQATVRYSHTEPPNATHYYQGKTLMTWFTTFKETATREVIQQSTLINRGKFLTLNHDCITPVLFLTKATKNYESIARDNGWHVHDVPRTNQFGSPFIVDMIKVITSAPYQNSTFFGFANGDILFDESIITTLKSIARILENNKKSSETQASAGLKQTLSTPLLIVGRRTNSQIGYNTTIPVGETFFVEQLRRKGKLHWASSVDYFIFTPDFPWNLFNGLVIARPGYDNYILLVTSKRRLNVIDATHTVTAVHLETPREQQLKKLGERKWGTSKNDINYNRNKLKGFDFAKGVISLTPYFTDVNVNCMCLTVRARHNESIQFIAYPEQQSGTLH